MDHSDQQVERAAKALVERECDQVEADTDGAGTLDRWAKCDEATRDQYRAEVRFVLDAVTSQEDELRAALEKIAALRKDSPSPDARYAQALAEETLAKHVPADPEAQP